MVLDVAKWISVGLGNITTLFREKLVRDHISVSDTLEVTTPDGTTIKSSKSKEVLEFERELNRRAGPIKNVWPRKTKGQQRFIGYETRRLGRAPSVLWVDDHPNNNNYPHKSFVRIGMQVKQVTSTDAALQELERHRGDYDVVITDMQRGDQPRAGYDLLSRLQAAETGIQVVIYSAGSRSTANREEAITKGALAATNTPERLFEYVTYAIAHASPPRQSSDENRS